jgi:PDZ domain-containing protein
MVAAGLLAVMLAILQPPSRSADTELRQAGSNSMADLADSRPESAPVDTISALEPTPQSATNDDASKTIAERLAATRDKLERLAQIRESFRALAAGAPASALRAAKQIEDETEREVALFTLVTEWTHGDVSPPRARAAAIAAYGLEAGLGIELAKSPELAILWANELTDGDGRAAVLQRTAVATLDSDPAAAFALSEQLPQEQRRAFFDSVFAGWAERDTTAALNWADQFSDPAERDSALKAIRSVAPVGIGAALSVQQGYAVINQLLPGTPAELSGQLRPGDRILAVAQGDNAFVNAHDLPLSDVVQLIRGAPGTTLQLQVLAADAPADSQPRIVSILRDQLRFKR